ncbi:hypothetical protein [Levilactobacillus acidifarinae]|nr:hypothetical protein [Levilactobacillus acidifarinae]GEO69097.1 hypothetical protein LAC03_10070 [Levilactobacillus acidifarinae]
MKQSDYIQELLGLINQQHSDLQNELNWFLALIGLMMVIVGLLQWRLSENQIKKMKADFRNDYGIDSLNKALEDNTKLNEQLIDNIAASFKIQINTSGALLPWTIEERPEAFKGNIVSNFTASLKSAYFLDALSGDVLKEAKALLENYMLLTVKESAVKEMSYPIVKNVDTGVRVIERAFSEQSVDVKTINDFEKAKQQYYEKFNVKWQLENYTPQDNPTTRS